MNKILYVGEEIGVEDTAMFIHCQNMASLLQICGYDVEFITMGNTDSRSKVINGFNYHYCYKKFYNGIIGKLESAKLKIHNKQLYKKTSELLKNENIAFVFYYGYSAEKQIQKECQKVGVPFIIERVDWFEGRDRKRFFDKLIYQRLVDKSFNSIDILSDGIIVISDYLQEFFSKKKVENIIFIPPIFKSSEEIISRKNNKNLQLVYCGSLGDDKDIIYPLIDAVNILNKNEIVIELQIIGVTREQYMAKFNITEDVKGVCFWGRINNEKARGIISSCDFSFLLRHCRRYSKAGFSTKFAESLLLGVPIICNKVGGADKFIENYKNGVLLENTETETIKKELEKILLLNNNDLNNMKLEAQKTAKNLFLMKNYVDRMNRFLNDVKKNM